MKYNVQCNVNESNAATSNGIECINQVPFLQFLHKTEAALRLLDVIIQAE